MTSWGIAPYAKEQLRKNIDKAEYVVVSFDESLNHTTQSCQMDLLLRYWDNHDQQVKVRYWDSTFLTHTTNKDLFILFIYLFISIYLSLTNFISPYNQTSLPQTARLVSNIRCDQQHCGMLLSLTPDI